MRFQAATSLTRRVEPIPNNVVRLLPLSDDPLFFSSYAALDRRHAHEIYQRDLNILMDEFLHRNEFFLHADVTSILALDIGGRVHQGLRKDGITPSFHHEVRTVLSLLSLRHALKSSGVDPDAFFASVLLHDVPEKDPSFTREKIRNLFSSLSPSKADFIAQDSWGLNKFRKGKELPPDKYHAQLSPWPRMLQKLAENLDNMRTITALPPAKQLQNLAESALLRQSSRNIAFPDAIQAAVDKINRQGELILKAYPAMKVELKGGIKITDALKWAMDWKKTQSFLHRPSWVRLQPSSNDLIA